MTWQTPPTLLSQLLELRSVEGVEGILDNLPIVSPEEYQWDYSGRRHGQWQTGNLHWVPVGLDRGNAGRVRLAGEPVNPIAERLVNGMEAIIELERLRELKEDPDRPCPGSPRMAANRYFDLPPLDLVECMDVDKARNVRQRIDEVRQRLVIRLSYESKQFSVSIRDIGVGQAPNRLHETLLSLGNSDKPDKPYLIGLFGQGGSSAFSACKYSVIVSRRAPDVRNGDECDGVGWSIVRQIFPHGRRDPYFAYLAESEDGAVPKFDAAAGDAVTFAHGTYFNHIGYDFGGSSSAVTRTLYQALNHVLFNPILPYDLYAMKDKPELMQGTAQRLARRIRLLSRSPTRLPILDKSFPNQVLV